MVDVEIFCRHFKLLRENCDLEVSFSLSACHKHKREKAIIYLNFEDGKNIDIKLKREKLEEYVNNLLSKNSGWFVFPSFRKYKTQRKRFRFQNTVEFVLKRDFSTF